MPHPAARAATPWPDPQAAAAQAAVSPYGQCTPLIGTAPAQMLDNNSSVEELKRAEEKMCDGALTAFRRAVREISRSAKLQAFNKNEEILKYFDGDYQTVSPPLVPPLRPGRPMQPSLRA